MRTVICLIGLLFFGQVPSLAQEKKESYLGSTDLYEFYAPYWFNLHHFLHYESLLRSVADSSIIPQQIWQDMSSHEQTILQAALSYYEENMAEQNLRSSSYLYAFKQWVVHQSPDLLREIPEQFQLHCEQLQAASEVYLKYFYDNHRQSIRARFQDNLQLIDDTEEAAADRLTILTRDFWDQNKIRVDICYYGSASAYNLRPRPYTTLFPTHVVMNAMQDADLPRGNWLELLYHESSHHLISSRGGFVGGTIGDASGFPHKKSPRDLWHAYLFYFSGVVTQDLLKEQGMEDYELYMVRKRVFSYYYPHLDTHLPAYMRFEKSLFEVSKEIIEAIR